MIKPRELWRRAKSSASMFSSAGRNSKNYDMLSGVLYAIAYLQPGAFPLFSAAGDFRPQMEHQGGAHQTEPDSRCHDRNQHC